MKKKTARFVCMIVLVLLISALSLNVFVMRKFIRTYTCTAIEYRGYTTQDIAGIRIDHSYIRKLLSYNEWRISVEFKAHPDVFFWFTYRDKKIVFEGVSAEPMPDKETVIEYAEKFKNGSLLKD